MQKINNFFPHDFHARDDTKLKKVRMQIGMEGIGLYWCIIEFLYENNGYLNVNEDIEMLAYELRVDKDKILNLIENFGLFKVNKNKFYSSSCLNRIKTINEKSEKARKSVQARWEKHRQKSGNTEMIQEEYESNTNVLLIKENKVKENKVKENNNYIQSISNDNIYSFTEQNFGRCLSPIEIEKINFWLNEFNEEILKEAISIAVMNRKCNFAYINAILNDWKGKGLQSLLEIREETQKFSKRKEGSPLTEEEKELFNYNWLEDEDSL